MDDLYRKLPGRRRFASPMPTAPAEDDAPPSWLVGLTAVGAFASLAFTVLLYLNNR